VLLEQSFYLGPAFIIPSSIMRSLGWQKLKLLGLIVLLSHLLSPANAFQTPFHNDQASKFLRLSRLSMSSVPQDQPTCTALVRAPRTIKDRLPEWRYLPNRRRRDLQQVEQALDQLELIVGRAAMVGATVLLIQEVFTGESILEQCSEALGNVVACLLLVHH
jgi:hypothetical protein